jgi:hypothetical protein
MSWKTRIVRFLKQERGAVITSETVLWGSITGLGLIAIIITVRIAVVKIFVGAAVAIAAKDAYVFDMNPDSVGYTVETRGTLLDPLGPEFDAEINTDPGAFSLTAPEDES